jgi:DNA repair photolyase
MSAALLNPPAAPLPLDPVPQLDAKPVLHNSRWALPRVECVPGPATVLRAGPVAGRGDIMSLNLTRGGAHGGSFCCVRGSAGYRGDETVYLFADTAKRLAEELASRRQQPRAVYVSPATDPFPPLGAVQAETARVVEVLAGHGVEACLMTRGFIRPAARRVLESHRDHVKVTVGLMTLDRLLTRALEPLAAPPRLRLRQIAHLRRLGISVQVALEPLIPGVTDTRPNLKAVLEQLAGAGVTQLTAGYLFLRPGFREGLLEALERAGWDEGVLDGFAAGPLLHGPGMAPAQFLPKERRQRGYASLMALATDYGIAVRVSSLTNPDFRRAPRPGAERAPRQRLLPQF